MNGKREGPGKMIWSNGEEYNGEWKSNLQVRSNTFRFLMSACFNERTRCRAHALVSAHFNEGPLKLAPALMSNGFDERRV